MKQCQQARSSATTTLGPGYIRRNQTSRYLDISIRQLAEWQRQRRIPYSKIGGAVFFRVSDLDAFIDAHRVEAKAV